MSQRSIGPLLRKLRSTAGRSQAMQAAVLSQFAGRTVTRHEVSRWEREIRLLTPFWQQHYAASLNVPVERLRLAVATAKAQRRQREDRVQRRQFISVMAGLALPTVDGVPTRVGRSDVDRLVRHTARLRRMDDVMGGGDTYGIFAGEVRRTIQLLAEARHTEVVGRTLRSLLAEQTQLAGWAAFDAGDHNKARAHYRDSYQAAEEAGDDVLAGNALAFTAYQQTMTSNRGAEVANASWERARPVATPRVAALLLERSAWAHAVAGQAREADRALSQAREELHRDSDCQEPDWVFWVDAHELDIMAGRCWTELQRPLRAVPVLQQVLDRFDDTHARDKALYLTWLASAYLQAREVEQAAVTLGRAFELAAGVASVRPSERIIGLARRLESYREVPEVADTLGRIDQTAVADSSQAR